MFFILITIAFLIVTNWWGPNLSCIAVHACMHAKSLQLCLSLCKPSRLLCPRDSPGSNTGVGCLALLQGIFPTQGSNPGLLYWRWILYHLSHQGSPWILERVVYPFSRGSSRPTNWTGSPALQADSLPAELHSKCLENISYQHNHHRLSFKDSSIWQGLLREL